MLFSKGRPADEPHQYTFYDKTLEPVEEHKHLGVTLSNKMSWEPQINVVVTKMTKLVNMMRPLKGVFPRKALEIKYKSHIRPHADYAACVLGELTDSHSKKLESIQYRAGLVVSGLPKTCSYNEVLDELGWSKLEERRKALRLSLSYKIVNNTCPRYLRLLLQESEYNTTT